MIDFQTAPDRYRHWKLSVDGRVATLAMDVDEAGGLVPGYELKLNSYDLGVDIELADAVQRLRFEHPAVACVVLTSALMSGGKGNKCWVRDSVFDHELSAITVPLLLIGHGGDKCLRSPPDDMPRLFGRIASARKQMVTVTGGPGWRGGLHASSIRR